MPAIRLGIGVVHGVRHVRALHPAIWFRRRRFGGLGRGTRASRLRLAVLVCILAHERDIAHQEKEEHHTRRDCSAA